VKSKEYASKFCTNLGICRRALKTGNKISKKNTKENLSGRRIKSKLSKNIFHEPPKRTPSQKVKSPENQESFKSFSPTGSFGKGLEIFKEISLNDDLFVT